MDSKFVLAVTIAVVTVFAFVNSVSANPLLTGIGGLLDNEDDGIIVGPAPPINIFNGSKHVRSVTDLVNLIFGLGGHVVGRVGWMINNAFGSLSNGYQTSRYRLGGPSYLNKYAYPNYPPNYVPPGYIDDDDHDHL